MGPTSEQLPLGIIVERQTVAHRWANERWRPVEVLPGAPAAAWRELAHGPGWTRYHAATLPLELHRKETGHYRYNLSHAPPRLFVVMRPSGEDAFPLRPFHVTASPFEAMAHMEFGDDRVEPVPMPPGLVALIQDFIDRHHVEEPFYKRRRKGRDKGAGEASEFVPAEGSPRDE